MMNYTEEELKALNLRAVTMDALDVNYYQDAYDKIFKELSAEGQDTPTPEAIKDSLKGLAATLGIIYVDDIWMMHEVAEMYAEAPEDKKGRMMDIYRNCATFFAASVLGLVNDTLCRFEDEMVMESEAAKAARDEIKDKNAAEIMMGGDGNA